MQRRTTDYCNMEGLTVTTQMVWFGLALALFYGIGYVRGFNSGVRMTARKIQSIINAIKEQNGLPTIK
jgi:hypothetical protein